MIIVIKNSLKMKMKEMIMQAATKMCPPKISHKCHKMQFIWSSTQQEIDVKNFLVGKKWSLLVDYAPASKRKRSNDNQRWPT